MSTSLSQPTPESSWKQEVNRRLAAHKSRRGLSAVQQAAPVAVHHGASSRAAEAAARVAARYANAPSYSEMQAAEARAALRAAEVATQVALEAQAVAQAALEDLEEAAAASLRWEPQAEPPAETEQAREWDWEPAPDPTLEPELEAPQPAAQVAAAVPPSPSIRWEPDFPERKPQPLAGRAARPAAPSAPASIWERQTPAVEAAEDNAIEVFEPTLSTHANLIQFPRELVATRKARPRLAEGVCAAVEPERQLSIFEVDPGALYTQPEAAAEPATGVLFPSGPEWSGLELEAQPLPEPEAFQEHPAARTALQLAPLGRRLLATVVDSTLVAGTFLGAAAVAISRIDQLPPARTMEIGAGAALLLIGVLYQTLFFTLAEATPGMKYARLSVCTFDERRPSRAQLRHRLGALLLSLLPVGLGVVWAVFDEEHLSWHDRLSKTYLRRS